MNIERKSIPKDWDLISVEDCFDILDNQRKPLNESERNLMRGDIPYYGANGVVDYVNEFLFDDDLILIAEDGGYFDEFQTRPIAYKVKGKAWINNHAHVLKAKNGFYQDYLFYCLEHKNILIWLNGGTRAKLNKGDLEKLPIQIAPLPEQKAIAQVLSTADAAIHTTEKLIAQKELRKKWLMQQLLTGKKRLKGFDGEWEDVELGELLDYEQPTKHLVKDTLYNDSYSTPVLTAGKTFILGYTNETNGICQDLPVVIFDDFTTASKFVDFPFKAKSSAMKLLRAKPNANLKYVYESMQFLNYTVGGHERHWISKFVYLTIPCPPIEEQTAIAQVLQAADKEINLLKAKAEKLRAQKKGLMQQLLTGKKRLIIS